MIARKPFGIIAHMVSQELDHQKSWEEAVEEWIEVEFDRNDPRYANGELFDAIKEQARRALLLGGRSGKEVTRDQIQNFFNARLRLALLQAQPRSESAGRLEGGGELDTFQTEFSISTPPDDLEILQQAVHLDLPLGKRAAIRWLKNTRTQVQFLRAGEPLMDALIGRNQAAEREEALRGNSLQRHHTAMGHAIKLIESTF